MPAILDLIGQVEDKRLRERLQREWGALSREKKFGLVFEEHLPELLPVYDIPVRPGDLAARKNGSLTEFWRVRSIQNGSAKCSKADGSASSAQLAEIALADLVALKQFGDPIFPSLVPVDAICGDEKAPIWHALIEADNYHALQLLEYLYGEKVDCIYIDPPYNTGAKDWKYNNDYVDGNDAWRHSKWLSFMERRLRIAKKLLKPDTGVLIVTIDEHEVHHLGMLLEDIFPEAYRQLATIVINQKGVSQGRLSRVEEYALYCFGPSALVAPDYDDLLAPDRSMEKRFQTPRWEWLQRGGNNATPDARPGLFYPIHIDPATRRIRSVGRPLPKGASPGPDQLGTNEIAWPIRRDKSYATWQVGPQTLERLISNGLVRLGGFDKKRSTWTIQYLGTKAQQQIKSGVLQVVGKDETLGCIIVAYTHAEQRSLKTVWQRGLHDSGVYGSTLLKTILGRSGTFSFPKSVYATRDAVAAVVRDRPKALIVDFFAGSGTTLNAVNLLNAADGGTRQCILVTNNEVSAVDAAALRERGLQPGATEWEQAGICRSVTWPRSKYTIAGKRDDGTPLEGDYLTGRTIMAEKARKFVHINFVDPSAMNNAAQKRQLMSVLRDLPSTVDDERLGYFVSEGSCATILFRETDSDLWLAALDGQEHLTTVYIVASAKKTFERLKGSVEEILNPITVAEDEKRPLSLGFKANLAYFRLAFLDKDRVALRRAFSEILPLLWFRAGAIGPCPTISPKAKDGDVFLPKSNPFAVLLKETAIAKLLSAIEPRKDVNYIFIVTDDEDAFREIAAEVSDARVRSGATAQCYQLYRDYLENFVINRHSFEADELREAAE